ncbi:hypothetical protein RRG08_003481 [Elysia crispata]|uniref:Uncharacterized protein n=1 Tax=Elysia crispata TaxID=231223 RepID=A0AAE1CTJ7_9GAST|nr:hypothetical protein RRG08_003481 [Elysia crispata]
MSFSPYSSTDSLVYRRQGQENHTEGEVFHAIKKKTSQKLGAVEKLVEPGTRILRPTNIRGEARPWGEVRRLDGSLYQGGRGVFIEKGEAEAGHSWGKTNEYNRLPPPKVTQIQQSERDKSQAIEKQREVSLVKAITVRSLRLLSKKQREVSLVKAITVRSLRLLSKKQREVSLVKAIAVTSLRLLSKKQREVSLVKAIAVTSLRLLSKKQREVSLVKAIAVTSLRLLSKKQREVSLVKAIAVTSLRLLSKKQREVSLVKAITVRSLRLLSKKSSASPMESGNNLNSPEIKLM